MSPLYQITLFTVVVVLIILLVKDPYYLRHKEGFTDMAWKSRAKNEKTLYDQIEARDSRRFTGLLTPAYLL